MEKILEMILKRLSWQRALKLVWKSLKPIIDKKAAQTETSFDEDMVQIADEIIKIVTDDKAAA